MVLLVTFTAYPKVGSCWLDRPIPTRVVRVIGIPWVAHAIVFQVAELCRQMVAVRVLNSDVGCQGHRSPEGLFIQSS